MLRIKQIQYKKQIIESIGYTAFIMILIICIETQNKKSPACIISILSFAQRFLWIKYIKKEYDNYTKIVRSFLIQKLLQFILIFKILIHLAVFQFLLRYDEYINWKWEAIFWPLYIICSLALVFSVSTSLICAGSICSLILKHTTQLFNQQPINTQKYIIDCLGLYTFYLINGFTGSLVATIIRLIKTLIDYESEQEHHYQIGLCFAVYLFCLLVLTLINFQYLQQWLIQNIYKQNMPRQVEENFNVMQIQRNRSNNQLNNQQVQQRQQRQNLRIPIQPNIREDQKQTNKNEMKEQIEETPRYLMLISGSYFKTLKDYSKTMYDQLQKVTTKPKKVQKIKPIMQNNDNELYSNKQKDHELSKGYEKEFQKRNILYSKFNIGKEIKVMSVHTKQKIDSNQKVQKPKPKLPSIISEDQLYFSDAVECQNDQQSFDQMRSRNYVNEEITVDNMIFETKDQTMNTTFDKQKLLDTLKKSLNPLHIQQTTQPNVLTNIHSQTKALIQNKQTIDTDTYEEFKQNPQQFKQMFKRRLSCNQIDSTKNIKNRISIARQKLRERIRQLDGKGLDNIKSQDRSQKIDELKKECLICLSGVADAVILKCGHGGLCFECGKRMSANRQDQRCHLCRKKIKMILRIDLNRISGQFVPILYYLDLRGLQPEIKQIRKPNQQQKQQEIKLPVIDIDSVLLTINDEILSDDSRHMHNYNLQTKDLQDVQLRNTLQIQNHKENQLQRSNSQQFDAQISFQELLIPQGDLIDNIQLRTIESDEEQKYKCPSVQTQNTLQNLK